MESPARLHLTYLLLTGILRATNVLKYYRGFVWPDSKEWQGYVERLLAHPAVKRTSSTDQLYLDSYERSEYFSHDDSGCNYDFDLRAALDTLSIARTRARLRTPSTLGKHSRNRCCIVGFAQ